jgi:cation transport ATPase
VSYDEPYNYLAGPIQIHFRIRIPEYATVAGNEGSTVVVVMNSLRLLFGRSLLPKLEEK